MNAHPAPTLSRLAPPEELLRRLSIIDLRRLELRSKRRIDTELLGSFKSSFRGSGLLFSELREYQPGDDVKHIHWKASARSSRVYVKSFVEDRALRVLLVLDVSASVACRVEGTPPQSAYERAIECAALIALITHRSHDGVGLACVSDRVESYLPPRHSRSQFHRIIQSLVTRTSVTPRTNLAHALRELSGMQRHRSVIFLFSDFFSPNFDQELLLLARRHELVLCDLHDSLMLPGAPHHLLEVFDAESGVRRLFDAGSAAIRREVAARARVRRSALHDLAARCGADYMNASGSVVRELHLLLRRRALRFR